MGIFISSLVLIPVNWFAYVHSVRMVLQRMKEKIELNILEMPVVKLALKI